MYGRFLEEAAGLLEDPRLGGIGQELQAIGSRWEEVARAFTRAAAAPNPADMLQEATALLPEIADREEKLWTGLAGLVC